MTTAYWSSLCRITGSLDSSSSSQASTEKLPLRNGTNDGCGRGIYILRRQTSVAKTPHGLGAAQRSTGTGCSYAEVGRCEHHGSMMGSEALMQVGRISLLLCDWVIHCALHKSCCMSLMVLHKLVLQGTHLCVAAKTACKHLVKSTQAD